MRVLVLGAGMVGSVAAADLAATPGFEVTVADTDRKSLTRARTRSGGKARTLTADAGGAAKAAALVRRTKADLVLGALPSRFGFDVMGGVISAKRPYV
ncbi:MAG: saccharopine dehydrogenase NADP-binding domain-containing protein, partial [Phycisphaerales bacterium]